MTPRHRPSGTTTRSKAARAAARRDADGGDAELAALAELGALRSRRSGFESFGFVVGKDGSATGGSATAALAAIGVVSGQRHPVSGAAAADEATVIDLTVEPVVAPPRRAPRIARPA